MLQHKHNETFISHYEYIRLVIWSLNFNCSLTLRKSYITSLGLGFLVYFPRLSWWKTTLVYAKIHYRKWSAADRLVSHNSKCWWLGWGCHLNLSYGQTFVDDAISPVRIWTFLNQHCFTSASMLFSNEVVTFYNDQV